MTAAAIAGVGCTRFGRIAGAGTLELMAQVAGEAMVDAGIGRSEIDGLLCGYATNLPHLMLADLFAERMAMQPRYAHAVQLGGATSAGLVMLAADLVRAGRCRSVLVVAGENRLSGQSRNQSVQTLSQIGDDQFEVPNGPTVPAYYALLASRYMHQTGTTDRDLAELAVLMRANAQHHPGAHLREPIDVETVLDSRPVSTPLKLLDCCPISDGAAAVVVAASRPDSCVTIMGCGQAHRHQHVTALEDIMVCGAAEAARLAFNEAHLSLPEIEYLAVYDSFTITLAILLEELGVCPRGQAGAFAAEGRFSRSGDRPLNSHGGLLSFGHSGVAGGMAHIVEAALQLRGEADARQAARVPATALVHADGGVMSAHVSLVLGNAA